MSIEITKDSILSEIDKLNQIFKEKSSELVGCRSLIKEQEIRSKMQECEVKKRVLLRKLQEFEISS